MQVTLRTPWPEWLLRCTDDDLIEVCGGGSVARGALYAKRKAVRTLVCDDDELEAVVSGSGGRVYETVVSGGVHDGEVEIGGECSCPMDVDCKHVVAVVLTARRLARAAAPGPSTALSVVREWEARLAPLLDSPDAEPEMAPVALQLELVATTPSRHDATAGTPRLKLRAVVPGKNGRWVRTGATWRDVDNRWSGLAVGPEQREALRAFLTTQRSRQSSTFHGYGYGDTSVHLDELGPTAWSLVDRAVQTGIALLSTAADRKVELAAPATVVVDAGRRGGDLSLTPVARLVDGPDVALDDLVLVGAPAHGAFRVDAESLLLLPFTAPLAPAADALARGGTVTVPESDVPDFLQRFYPALRRRAALVSLDGSVELPEVRPPHLVLQVAFEPGHRTVLGWCVGYPSGDRVTLVRGADQDVTRDLAAERALVAGLPDLPGVDRDPFGHARLVAETVLEGMATARFVRDTLPLVHSLDTVVVEVTGEPATYGESSEPPRITVSTKDSDQTDWFDLQVSVSVADEDVPVADLLAAIAHGLEELLLPSGTWFGLDRPELGALRRVVEEARALTDRESTSLRLTPFHAGLWEELVSLGVVEHQSARWSATVGGLLALEALPTPPAPAGLQATLRPYQLEGYHWLSLLWDHQLGGILADDMGLGKTLQALAMTLRAKEQGSLGGEAGPLLVVAPTSVVSTWAREAARFAPSLTVVTVTETAARSGLELTDLVGDTDVVITSYALFRIDEDAYQGLTWSGLVLDEAQFVKNHQAKTYQCARRLRAPFKLAITGTPLENSLMDLWSMLSITAPGLFPNPQRFTELYRRPIESGGAPEVLAALRRRIRPLMLRRTKDQVAVDLPPKVEQVLSVELNPAHRKVYDKHLARERQRVLGLLDDLQRNRIAILRSLTVLRQLSLDASLVDDAHAGKVRSSKIDVLLEQLQEVVAEGHRVLVFSQFTGFLSLVKARLDAEGIGYCYLDGRTRNRPARIAEFTEGTAPVFLISLKAGGVGLTLTEADYVFVLDPWWNPAAEAQAVDRAHRIGQSKTVMVYRLVATDTIEEKVVALQQRKRDLFAQVVDDDAMTGSAMTADDIRGLFT